MTIKLPCIKCGVLTTKSYCVKHQPEYITKPYRLNSYRRGYDRTHTRLAKQQIAREPYCAYCGTEGTTDNPLTADHIIPLKKGGTNTPENYQTLCRRHNSRKQDD